MRIEPRSRRWSARWLRHTATALATLTAACATDAPESGPPDAGDDHLLRLYDLAVPDGADLAALVSAEVPFQGPVVNDRGESVIRIFGTETEARELARYGLALRGPATTSVLSDDPAFTAEAVACTQPSACSVPTGSQYFKDYADITAEMNSIEAAFPNVDVRPIGKSTTKSTEIMAIEFHATEGPDTAPTLYLLGTYHAREWLGTAVTIQLMRWLNELKQAGTVDGVSDPELVHDLAYASVVVVPVVNPDGYAVTRDGNPNDRLWRGNTHESKNGSPCAGGVDLNRNHTTAWKPGSANTDTCGGNNTQFRGDGPGSELETQAIENLLTGGAFSHPQQPIALISYHTYADFVVYPEGWKQDDTNGPECHAAEGHNCFNADFTVLRDLFGDTHSKLWTDAVSAPGQSFPYYRDHGRTILYPASGEVGIHAMYGPVPMLAVTPELASNCFGFRIECDPNADDVVRTVAADQLDVVRRILHNAPALASTNVASAYGPNTVGARASGLWTREYRDDPEAVRATFVKSIWKPLSTGTLQGTIDGTTYPYKRGRTAAHYELYTLDPDEVGLDSQCLPCDIQTSSGEGQHDSAPECSGCIKLCDPDRLKSNGWKLAVGDRGHKSDCWWWPADSSGTLAMPHMVVPKPDTTHCHFTFSAEWGSINTGAITIERENTGGGWDTLMTIGYESPYFTAAQVNNKLLSYAFEADNFMASGEIPAFRFRANGTVNQPESVRIFDPVVYCRSGALH